MRPHTHTVVSATLKKHLVDCRENIFSRENVLEAMTDTRRLTLGTRTDSTHIDAVQHIFEEQSDGRRRHTAARRDLLKETRGLVRL